MDKTIKELFGEEEKVDFEDLANKIIQVGEKIPEIPKNSPYLGRNERNFIISEEPCDADDLFENIAGFFSDSINWKSARAMLNVTPPAVISGVAASSIVSLLNPNGVWDIASGRLLELEQNLSKYFSDLIGWEESNGFFTFGGTSTNLYGIKLGLNKANENAASQGTIGADNVVFSNNEGHSCHVSVCNWLGIGTENCIRMKNNASGEVDFDSLINGIEKAILDGKKVACIVLNGGSNFDGVIDPIGRVSEKLVKLKNKYSLDYLPHIHVDSVLGWVYLLFKEYNFVENPLNISEQILATIKKSVDEISELEYADSMGIDFHKTGYCSYLSSMFISKNKKDWAHFSGGEDIFSHQSFDRGKYQPGKFTLETSRPLNGAVSAYITLNALGLNGVRKVIVGLYEASLNLKKKLSQDECFVIGNMNPQNWATIFMVSRDKRKKSLSDFMGLDEVELKKHNDLQKEFYNYVMDKSNDDDRWLLGFASSYKKTQKGFSIAGLKSYPMSPYFTKEKADELSVWLHKKREDFLELKNQAV